MNTETKTGGILDFFSEAATETATDAVESALLTFIEVEKKKAIDQAKREVAPVAIGLGLVAGLLGGFLSTRWLGR